MADVPREAQQLAGGGQMCILIPVVCHCIDSSSAAGSSAGPAGSAGNILAAPFRLAAGAAGSFIRTSAEAHRDFIANMVTLQDSDIGLSEVEIKLVTQLLNDCVAFNNSTNRAMSLFKSHLGAMLRTQKGRDESQMIAESVRKKCEDKSLTVVQRMVAKEVFAELQKKKAMLNKFLRQVFKDSIEMVSIVFSNGTALSKRCREARAIYQQKLARCTDSKSTYWLNVLQGVIGTATTITTATSALIGLLSAPVAAPVALAGAGAATSAAVTVIASRAEPGHLAKLMCQSNTLRHVQDSISELNSNASTVLADLEANPSNHFSVNFQPSPEFWKTVKKIQDITVASTRMIEGTQFNDWVAPLIIDNEDGWNEVFANPASVAALTAQQGREQQQQQQQPQHHALIPPESQAAAAGSSSRSIGGADHQEEKSDSDQADEESSFLPAITPPARAPLSAWSIVELDDVPEQLPGAVEQRVSEEEVSTLLEEINLEAAKL